MQPQSQGLNSVQEPKSLQRDWAGAGTEVDVTTSKQPEDLTVTLKIERFSIFFNFSLQMTTRDLENLAN